MKLTKFLAGAFALSAILIGCKEDPFVEPETGDDSYAGVLFINETSGSSDFVEIYNTSSEEVDLSGFMINDDATYDEEAYLFPEGSVIKANGFVAVYKDTDFTFGISSSGDNIYLVDASGELVDSLVLPEAEEGMASYGRTTDGGSILGWFITATPGESNAGGNTETPDEPVEVSSPICINESSYDSDFIELYNTSDEVVSLAGYVLSDDKGFDSSEAYTIPEGVEIAPQGFYLATKGYEFTFGIGGGDKLQLFNAEGELLSALQLPEKNDGTASYGCATDGDTENLVEFTTATPGLSNTTVFEADYTVLNVNEGSYDDDFIEIFNSSYAELDISGLVLSDSNGFESEEAYVIPEGTVIAARGFYLATKDVEFEFGIGGADLLQIYTADGTLISSLQLPAKTDGLASYGCATDGDMNNLVAFSTSTPGYSNVEGGNYETSDLVGKLMINEIYTYGDQSSVDDLDWIELYNASDEEINLAGLMMWEGGGIEEAWSFPTGATIAAKSYFVVESDKYALYDNPVDYPAWGLSKGPDEKVYLATADGSIIDSVEDCPSMNEGETYGRVTDGASEFQIFVAGTKGTANTGDARTEIENTCGVYVNEVYHDNSDEVPGEHDWDTDRDFVEFYNATDADISLKGWSMTDDKATEYYYFPDDAVIKAGSFLVLEAEIEDENGDVIPEDYSFSFGLGKSGDWIHLFNADGDLVEQVEVPSFKSDGPYGEIIDLGCTYGRQTDGASNFVAFSEASKGASNNGKAQVVVE
ncbi:MAG: lamin tail domain-containing protein [Rikenellaceae bacterium]